MKKLLNILLLTALLGADKPVLTNEEIASNLLEHMSLEQKVAQMFIVRTTAITADMDLALHPVGGYCLFAYDIENPQQLKHLTDSLQNALFSPLLCIDEEGGRVARIAGNDAFDVPRFPNMGKMVEAGTTPVGEASFAIGSYLKEYGFNVDFAPVADVFTNPLNTVIGQRALSTSAEEATRLVPEYMEGLRKAGIVPCVKHFPGHGDTIADSHHGCASVSKDWDQMLQCEILPFKAAIDAGVPIVMVGHVSAPEVTGDNLPATLSEYMISGKLKGELGFKGIVITDSMAMGAVSKEYDSAQAAVMAVKAGVDIVLMPADFIMAYNGLLAAVESGEISLSRIEESVYKILMLKLECGAIKL